MLKETASLKENATMLYLLTASNYIIGFLSIPYLTRVLGAETYGRVGVGTAFYSYVQLILDFGFILSATARIAQHRDNTVDLNVVFSATMAAKLLLIVICGVATVVLCITVELFSSDPIFFAMYYLYAVANCLLPDFVYRGFEYMRPITIRTVLVKLVFLLGLFFFVKSENDYLLVPVLYCIGSTAALIAVYPHMRKKTGCWFCPIKIGDVINAFKDSFQFFLSRIAGTFYSLMNTMILGFLMPESEMLGWFTACNNCVSAGRSLCPPVSDSVYPYMLRTKNFPILNIISLIGEIILTPACIVSGIFAPQICVLLFGQDFYEAAGILRLMLPLIPIAFVSYLYAFPALVPLGRRKVANYSVVVGAIVQVVLLSILWFAGVLDPYSICISTLITEATVLLIRYVTFRVSLQDAKTSG